MVAGGLNKDGGREAAIHSGLESALGFASLRCPILLSSISIVRQVLFAVKRKASILENKQR